MIYVLDEREITTSTTTIRATHRRVAHINDSRGEARDNRGLYAALVCGLGGVPRFHTAALIAQTMDHLAAEKHERGRNVIVAVDEAHLLSADQLEELRLLTNSEMDSVAPFA